MALSAGKDEAQALEAVLSECGFQVAALSVGDKDVQASIQKADLVVVCGHPRSGKRWTKEQFEALRGKKVLAVGPAGAQFLGLGDLLIGDSYGWTGQAVPKRVRISASLQDTPFKGLLNDPYPILVNKVGSFTSSLTIIDSDSGGRTDTAIYDLGSFPKGTLGIGLEEGDLHHWLIAKQGNYVLWGAAFDKRSLTSEGRALFLNLCMALIAAPSEELVYPEKKSLKLGETSGVLRGGHRDIYYLTATVAGTFRVTLQWDAKHEMMLLTDAHRVDGKTPLSTTWDVSQSDVGKSLKVMIGSFDLAEGAQSRYSLVVSGP